MSAVRRAARFCSSTRASLGPVVRRVVRFGYDGIAFRGWARQLGQRTVEGEVRSGLLRLGIASPTDPLRVEVSSRTDRGVSARSNALTLESDLSAASLLRALNGIAPEIYFTATASVGASFRVRAAQRRVYRYYEPSSGNRAKQWARVARLLEGELDVRSFGRGVPAEVPTNRTVESVRVRRLGPGLVIEVTGPSFVWNQVRKMVGALREVALGHLSEERLAAAARGEIRITPPLVEPEYLILWEVDLPVVWEAFWRGPNRHQRAHLAGARAAAWSRMQLLSALPVGPDDNQGASLRFP